MICNQQILIEKRGNKLPSLSSCDEKPSNIYHVIHFPVFMTF